MMERKKAEVAEAVLQKGGPFGSRQSSRFENNYFFF